MSNQTNTHDPTTEEPLHTSKTKEIDRQQDTERQIDEYTRHNVNNQMQNQRPIASANHGPAERLRAEWKEQRSAVKAEWDRLTDDDLAQIDGSPEELAKALQRRYSYDRKRAVAEVERFLGEESR